MAYQLPGRPDRAFAEARSLTLKGVQLVQSAFDGTADDNESAMDEAIDCFKKALVKVPDFDEARYRLGFTCFLLVERVDDHQRRVELAALATEQFQRLLKLEPNDTHVLDLIGDTLFRQGTLCDTPSESVVYFDASIKHLEHLLELEPENEDSHGKACVSLGLAYAHRGANSESAEKLPKFLNAVRFFEEGIKLDAMNFSMLYNYATALMDVGKNSVDAVSSSEYYGRSLKVLTDAIEKMDHVASGKLTDEEVEFAIENGSGESLRYNHACLLSRMGKADDAIAALRALFTKHPMRANVIAEDPDFDAIRDLAAFKELFDC